jgi:DNA-binding NarL/FixJ family response regulator
MNQEIPVGAFTKSLPGFRRLGSFDSVVSLATKKGDPPFPANNGFGRSDPPKPVGSPPPLTQVEGLAGDAVALLKLTAELHEASRDPARWPQAWADLCEWMDCPTVFRVTHDPVTGSEPRSVEDLKERIVAANRAAKRCAGTCSGRCGQPETRDEHKRMTCLGIVEHLRLALKVDAPEGSAAGGLHFTKSLDALPTPMIWCRADLRLLHVNSAARKHLEAARWLVKDGEQIAAVGSALQRRLRLSVAEVLAQAPDIEGGMAISRIESPALDITVRRTANGSEGPVLLITLVIHEEAPKSFERRGWPPRQRELAGLLLAGHTLEEAAKLMGIARSTAVDHLRGLFRATGTNRQQDLIRYLSRDPFDQ